MVERFNTKDYVCKFIYKKSDTYFSTTPRQQITGDLYLNELKIELLDREDKVLQVFGYSLEDKVDSLLPLLHWEDFEKTRDESKHAYLDYGYRDGWGYTFVCMNESGKPLIKNTLRDIYPEKNKPAYEKLLDWIKMEYAGNKEFKKMKLFW